MSLESLHWKNHKKIQMKKFLKRKRLFHKKRKRKKLSHKSLVQTKFEEYQQVNQLDQWTLLWNFLLLVKILKTNLKLKSNLMNFSNLETQQEEIHYFHQANQDLTRVWDLIKALIQMQLKTMNMWRERKNSPRNIDFD